MCLNVSLSEVNEKAVESLVATLVTFFLRYGRVRLPSYSSLRLVLNERISFRKVEVATRKTSALTKTLDVKIKPEYKWVVRTLIYFPDSEPLRKFYIFYILSKKTITSYEYV